jgi:hypothetical protein
MARKTIRDFSGGLVTYQSELDISDNQFQKFDNAINTKRGSITKKGSGLNLSTALATTVDTSTEFLRYRTEKDASGNNTSTEWWVVANADKVYRSATDNGSWATINTYATLGSEMLDDGLSFATSKWTFGTGWSRVVGEANVYAQYSTGSGVGALAQSNTNMLFSLEKNKIYKLVFDVQQTLGSSVGITIKNSGLTETYISFANYNQATHTVYFSPESSSAGIAWFASASDGTSETTAFRIDNASLKEVPKHDLLVHNQVLRISDGAFLNNSKWYGHIKRDLFGSGIALTHYRFRTPPMATALNAWTVEDTELAPPVVVPMKYAFDQNNDINAANEVGIFVHYPDEETQNGDLIDTKLIPDAAANTFSSKDKYTVSFLYDYVQESELARDANGDIGVFPQNAPLSSGARCPGIQLVVDTGVDLARWNKRITGINLYWQPEDDVDWYLVTTYDTQDGFSEDPRAKDSATSTVILRGASITSNNGAWIPCLEPYGASSNDDLALNSDDELHTLTTLRGNTSWSFTNSNFAADKAIIVMHDLTSNDLANFAIGLKKTITYIANIKSISTVTLTTGTSAGAVNWGNWVGQTYADLATDYHWGSLTGFVCTVSTDKLATWYIPNDGLKLSTYNSLTGRAAETRLKPIKWNTATVVGNKAFYANIDFKDENDQTLREKNRIVFTDNFKLDEAVVGTKFVDVGKNDGDEITVLHSAQNRLYVFKTRNIYIYRIQSAQSVNFILERHIAGIGCLHKHAVIDTPFGICFADNKQVSLIRGTEVSELSLLIRDTYQALDLRINEGALSLGYHANINTLVVNYDFDANTMYAYNFDTQSWSKFDGFTGNYQSQFVLSDTQELQTYEGETKKVANVFSSTTNDATSTMLLKTKRYDFGLPDKFKRFTKLHITYKGSSTGTAMSYKVYIDGSDTASITQEMIEHSTLQTYSSIVNELGKSIEIEIYGVESNVRIDGIDIDYDIEGSNP